jgi:hypothetical protein
VKEELPFLHINYSPHKGGPFVQPRLDVLSITTLLTRQEAGEDLHWWSTNHSLHTWWKQKLLTFLSFINMRLPAKRCPLLEGHRLNCRAVQVMKVIRTLTKLLCHEVWLVHDVFLYHTGVCWLTRPILSRLPELLEEITMFLLENLRTQILSWVRLILWEFFTLDW